MMKITTMSASGMATTLTTQTLGVGRVRFRVASR
jgi:hypothetical protein